MHIAPNVWAYWFSEYNFFFPFNNNAAAVILRENDNLFARLFGRRRRFVLKRNQYNKILLSIAAFIYYVSLIAVLKTKYVEIVMLCWYQIFDAW